MINQIHVNMKKRLLLLLLMMALMPLSHYVMAQTINFKVGYVDPQNPFEEDHRSPVLIPEVEIEGYTLFFTTPCDGCVLRLLDENDDVVYSSVIPSGSTSLVLPSYLSGEYEIQIIQGNLCFWGYLSL